MAEHDAADGEHLGQVAQAQLVAQTPEHHERDDIGGILGPVQQGAGALVELLAARTTTEPAVTLGGALRPLRDGLRPAFYTPHPRLPLRERRLIARPTLVGQSSGASPDRTHLKATRPGKEIDDKDLITALPSATPSQNEFRAALRLVSKFSSERKAELIGAVDA